MPRRVDGDGSGWGKLFGKLSDRISDAMGAPPATKKKREKRFKMGRDSRRGMSGRGYLSQVAATGPMTLDELLARLDADERAAVLAMSPEQQADLLRLYEALDRNLQAPAAYKAAVIEKLERTIVNGRLVGDKRAHGGLLARLARRIGATPGGPLRGRMDGLMYVSHVIAALAEPRPGPAAGRTAAEQGVAALANSLALAWPARWGEIALDLAFGGGWQGILPVLRPGGSPPEGLVLGSLVGYAKTLPPEGEAGLTPGTGPLGGPRVARGAGHRVPRGAGPASSAGPAGPDAAPAPELTLGQLDLLGRLLETDRGAELDVEGRDPAWALVWLDEQIKADFPARAGIVQDGKGRTVRVTALSNRIVVCEELTMAPGAFLGALRRVVVDGDYLSRVGLG